MLDIRSSSEQSAGCVDLVGQASNAYESQIGFTMLVLRQAWCCDSVWSCHHEIVQQRWEIISMLCFVGSAQLSKVAAQLLANMSANEGPALHAVWSACFPGSFTKLAAFNCGLSLLSSVSAYRGKRCVHVELHPLSTALSDGGHA